nr:DapH/DapD/GlmU-related protein [Paenibacillus aestuarii]
MWIVIFYYLRVVYNLFALPFWAVLNGFRIKFSPIQKISSKANLAVGKSGRIILGARCLLETGVLLHAESGVIHLGEKVFFNRNCTVVSHHEIRIGKLSTFGPNVCIYDHDHDLGNWNKFVSKPIIIGEKVWVGANVVILKGVTIGNGAVIGAGSIVTKDIPPNTAFISKHGEYFKAL